MTNYKYLLTFDIGIKNLAYCITRYKKNEKNNFDILYWGILDISYKGLKCDYTMDISKKNNISIGCNNYSYFYTQNNGENYIEKNYISYCKNHANKINIINPLLFKLFKKISNNAKLKDNFNQQVERLLIQLDIFYKELLENIYDYDGNIYKFKIINKLDIYIENQPVLKNPIMKTISIVLYTFFNIKKINFPNIINSVNFVSATIKTRPMFINKLKKFYPLNTTIITTNSYQNRKQFCIDIISEIIYKLNNSVYNASAISLFEISKKKDDLADTLIYVLYVLYGL
jgi:hypothetical protein